MKKVLCACLLVCSIQLAFSQNFGFSLKRGACGIYPTQTAFLRSHSQMLGLGVHHSASLKNAFWLQTGLNFTMMFTTKTIATGDNEHIAMPHNFYALDVPLLLEKKFYHRAKEQSHFTLLAGVNAVFLWNDNVSSNVNDVDNRDNFLNPGGTLAFQYSIPINRYQIFSVGPDVKFIGTGGEYSKVLANYMISLSWKFGK